MGIRKIHYLYCGKLNAEEAFLETGKRGLARRTIPVPCYLIEHEKGLVLIDTGMNPRVIYGATEYWGSVAKRLFIPEYTEEQTPMYHIEQLGYKPQDIRLVINTHLHNDHAGCNQYFPNAEFILHEKEYEWAFQENTPPGYLKADFDVDQGFKLINQDNYDVFGDDSILLIETFGHTPGHCSILLQTTEGEKILLLGDVVYTLEQWENTRAPGHVWDKDLAQSSLEKLKAICAKEQIKVFVGHDQQHWDALRSTQIR